MAHPAPPREPGWRPNPTGLLALLVVVGVVVGVWWISGGDPGTPTRAPGFVSTDETPSPSPSPARSGDVDPLTGLRWVEVADLPPEAVETLALLERGGPYPYDEDGETFSNREGILPDRPEGTYTEYTVETPGSPDRGARRLVSGDVDGGADEVFWTEDHYDSFERVAR